MNAYSFKIIKADITSLEVEAIVNPMLYLERTGSQLNQDIYQKAGNQLLETTSSIQDYQLGDAIITKGFDLKSKHVIHVANTTHYPDITFLEKHLQTCFASIFKLVEENSIQTLAIPPLSYADDTFSFKVVEVNINAIKSYLQNNTSCNIQLVVNSNLAYSAFLANTPELQKEFLEKLYRSQSYLLEESKAREEEMKQNIEALIRVQKKSDEVFKEKEQALEERIEIYEEMQAQEEENKQNMEVLKMTLEESAIIKTQKLELEQKNQEIASFSEKLVSMNETLNDALTSLQTYSNTITEQNKNIIDSIQYAQNIQKAILPQDADIKRILPDSFIFFQPLNIVSGDFYYVREMDNKVVIAALDCTGHGVPGAFMTMIGTQILIEVIQTQETIHSDEILNRVHQKLNKTLKKNRTHIPDGMDAALVVWDRINNSIEFSGAKNPLYWIHKGNLVELDGNNASIGFDDISFDGLFNKYAIQLDKGEHHFYLGSDGFQDQFGGVHNKKFMKKGMKELLMEIHQKDFEHQRNILENTIKEWMHTGGEEQIDDMLIFGFKLTI